MRVHPLLLAALSILGGCVDPADHIEVGATDASPTDHFGPASIAISASGKIAVAWERSEYWTEVAVVEAGWVTHLEAPPTITSGTDVKPPSSEVAFEADGSLLLKTENSPTDPGVPGKLLVRRWNGRGWDLVGDIEGALGGGPIAAARMIVDSGGAPVVAAASAVDGGFNIALRRWDGTAWAPLTTDHAVASSNHPERLGLALDPSDRPSVLWVSDRMLVERWDGSAWRLLPSPGAAFGRSDLAVDSTGAPIVLATDSLPLFSLKRFEGMTWTSRDIPTGEPFPGEVSSLAVDQDDGVWVGWTAGTYWEFHAGVVQNGYVAHWTSGGWEPVVRLNDPPSWVVGDVRLATGGPYRDDPVVVWTERHKCSEEEICFPSPQRLYARIPR